MCAFMMNSAEKVKNQIEKDEGQKCLMIEVDLMKHEDCKRVVDEHMKAYGRLSCLVNNVGVVLLPGKFPLWWY